MINIRWSKVLWDSQSEGVLLIEGLEVATSFSIPEQELVNCTVFPNPVNDKSLISLYIPRPGLYKFELYSSLGQLVWNYIENNEITGNISYSWNELFPGNLPGGVYILNILAPGRKPVAMKIFILD